MPAEGGEVRRHGGGVERDRGDEACAGAEDAGEFGEIEGRAGREDEQVEGEVGKHAEIGGGDLDAANAAADTGGLDVGDGSEDGVAGGVEDRHFGSFGGEPGAEQGIAAAIEQDATAGEGLGGEKLPEDFGLRAGVVHGR